MVSVMTSDVSGDRPGKSDLGAVGAPLTGKAAGQGLRRTGKPARAPMRWSLPGFGPMTRITTSFGEVHAQALRTRDLVRSRSGEFKPIVWLDRIVLDDAFLRLHPDALPILVKAGALGRGLPKGDVTLSPRQPVPAAENHLPSSVRTAADLLNRPGVFRKPETTLTYTLFHCGEPQTVLTEKLWVHVAP